jgi:hypothetical protein
MERATRARGRVHAAADRRAGAAIRGATEGFATRADLERLEAMVRELLARTAPAPAAPVPAQLREREAIPPPPAPRAEPAAKAEAEITAEEIVLIAAAVTSFLGKSVRVRGARRIPPPAPIVSAWGLQGRVYIQASHALAARRGH